MRWEAIARHVDSADDSGNLLFDNLGQATLFIHGIREEIHLVLKKLDIVAQSLEIVRQETPTASDVFVDLPLFTKPSTKWLIIVAMVPPCMYSSVKTPCGWSWLDCRVSSRGIQF